MSPVLWMLKTEGDVPAILKAYDESCQRNAGQYARGIDWGIPNYALSHFYAYDDNATYIFDIFGSRELLLQSIFDRDALPEELRPTTGAMSSEDKHKQLSKGESLQDRFERDSLILDLHVALPGLSSLERRPDGISLFPADGSGSSPVLWMLKTEGDVPAILKAYDESCQRNAGQYARGIDWGIPNYALSHFYAYDDNATYIVDIFRTRELLLQSIFDRDALPEELRPTTGAMSSEDKHKQLSKGESLQDRFERDSLILDLHVALPGLSSLERRPDGISLFPTERS